MKQTFETYLEEYFIGLNEWDGTPIHKDNFEDMFDRWMSQLDVQEVIDLADAWGDNKK